MRLRWSPGPIPPVALLLMAFLAGGADAQPAADNPHGDLQIACAGCHNSSGWRPARITAAFDHSRFGFALDAGHAGVDCMACHRDLEFSTAGQECSDCHMDVHQGQLGLDCGHCHGARSFIDVADQRRLHREERFPLSGAHATAPCEGCHPVGSEGILEFIGIDDACVACHEPEFLAVKDPDHVAGGFADDCEFCHSTRTFVGGFFNHERQFAGAALICAECHQDAYDATTTPDHIDLSFSVECQLCHNTRRWEDAQFDHSVVADRLCTQCHQEDYDRTRDPIHADAGFSTQCEDCHNTRRWEDATADHRQFFPLLTGAHRGEWESCNDCHSNSGTFSEFSCMGCHPHSDRVKTDSGHSEVNGYAYDSFECYDCHPRGRTR